MSKKNYKMSTIKFIALLLFTIGVLSLLGLSIYGFFVLLPTSFFILVYTILAFGFVAMVDHYSKKR